MEKEYDETKSKDSEKDYEKIDKEARFSGTVVKANELISS